MKAEFWGTRGSIATPGLSSVRYGGNTACVSVRLDDGTLLILDAGTGIRKLGNVLIQERPVDAHLFLSHCHWDHIQGFPFFAPAYASDTRLSIYGYPAARRKISKTMTDQMESAYFPVDFSALSASIRFIDMGESSVLIGSALVSLVETNHPGGGVGLRIQEGDRSIVYLTDNELGCGNHERFVRFCREASILVHDAQYTPEELDAHRGWGHSCYREVLELARHARVERVALFHHDPERADDGVDAILRRCHEEMAANGDCFECLAAAEGLTLTL